MIPRSRRYYVYFSYIRFASETEEPEDCPIPQRIIAYDVKDAHDQAELIFRYGYPSESGTKTPNSDDTKWDDIGRDFVITRIEPADRDRTEQEYIQSAYVNRR